MINVENKVEEYDNLLGEMMTQSGLVQTACFGDKACQEAREMEFERQALELEVQRARLERYGTGGVPTRTIILISVAVLALFAVFILFKFKKK